ncbi:MAG: hypothetical protein A3C11_03170 [Candidatus Sungbacteria bacterium RIFCSPHIGHO2_02_FULL_49_12]|uniref:SHS2 domain-containing protein n=1 Tax=Candidatus Sungbacteria bacterium RIFCSPHIGHO2_02_FULL_49_12 TaxID=1802271 RepID=A0A1G2KR14_9BACT|nr:MAG: hypothetical protein A3C11_03170 [Candidatus Sungbacteria bacterium RIFCSPHIGHO2_02_FULL_49_12]
MFAWLQKEIPASIAVDISRSSVKIVAFRFDPRASEISYIDHQKVSLPAHADKLDNFIRALAAVEDFLDETIRHREIALKSVSISVPNAILASEVREFHFTRPHPTAGITDKELREVWVRLCSQAAPTLLPQGLSENSYEIFTPEAERITIDGYTLTGNLSGMGKEIMIATLVSAWPAEFHAAAEKLKNVFPKIRFLFIPEVVLIRDYVVLRRGPTVSGVALDIGGRDTTMLLFDHGVLEDLWVCPFGGQDVSHAVAKEFSISFVDAEMLKRQWVRGVLDQKTAEKLAAVTERVVDFWKREWGGLLVARAATAAILPQIYFMGRGALLPRITTAFSDSEWLETFSAGVASDVQILLPGAEEKEFFPGWPFEDAGDAVLFSLVSRMIR